MKKLEEYLRRAYRIELVPDEEESGYIAYFPELRGCISVGETPEEAIANAMDAKKEWLTAALEDGLSIPEPEAQENFSGQFKLRIPKALHRGACLSRAAGGREHESVLPVFAFAEYRIALVN